MLHLHVIQRVLLMVCRCRARARLGVRRNLLGSATSSSSPTNSACGLCPRSWRYVVVTHASPGAKWISWLCNKSIHPISQASVCFWRALDAIISFSPSHDHHQLAHMYQGKTSEERAEIMTAVIQLCMVRASSCLLFFEHVPASPNNYPLCLISLSRSLDLSTCLSWFTGSQPSLLFLPRPSPFGCWLLR